MDTGALYIGVGGHVVAVDLATGTEMWRTKLKRTSYVTLQVTEHAIYAGANGELFCLDPATGSIRWKNGLSGLGYGLITFGDNPEVIAADTARKSSQPHARH